MPRPPLLRLVDPIPAVNAVTAVTDLEGVDPRPAALVDHILNQLVYPRMDTDAGSVLMEHLACAVLARFGYALRGVDPRVIPARVRNAVVMAHLPESHGCRYCGVVIEDHGVRESGYVGKHEWCPATEDQQALRLRALIVEEERLALL